MHLIFSCWRNQGSAIPLSISGFACHISALGHVLSLLTVLWILRSLLIDYLLLLYILLLTTLFISLLIGSFCLVSKCDALIVFGLAGCDCWSFTAGRVGYAYFGADATVISFR